MATYAFQEQTEGTCYAHAAARAMVHAWRRVAFATPPSYQQLLDAIVAKHGEHGGCPEEAVKHFGDPSNLTPAERSALFPDTDYKHFPKLVAVSTPPDQIPKILAELRASDTQMVVSFRFSKERWDRFDAFFEVNPSGVLQPSDLELQPGQTDAWGEDSGRHGTIIDLNACVEGSHIAIRNSWGPRWGDGGYFRIADLSVLEPHREAGYRVRAFTVEWNEEDIGPPLRARFRQHCQQLGASPTPRLQAKDCVRGGKYIDPITRRASPRLYNATLDGAPVVIKPVQVSKYRDLKFKFDHPNIVRVLGWRYHEDRATVYDPAAFASTDDARARIDMVMERGTGDLSAHAASLSVVERLTVLEQVASALRYLWEQHKVVRRDVKPENIVKVGDTWKLADFGITYHDGMYTGLGRGTRGWTDPLLLTRDSPTSAELSGEDYAKLDVYSLGALIRYLHLDQREVDCDGKFGDIADKCLQETPTGRPTADGVRRVAADSLHHRIRREHSSAALCVEDEREGDC